MILGFFSEISAAEPAPSLGPGPVLEEEDEEDEELWEKHFEFPRRAVVVVVFKNGVGAGNGGGVFVFEEEDPPFASSAETFEDSSAALPWSSAFKHTNFLGPFF